MLDREKVIKAYEDFVNGYECFCESDDYEYEMHKAVLALLKEQEADMIALKNAYKELAEKGSVIVRCKDCKKCDLPEEEPYEDGFCSRCGYVKMDWFCADGEKKDE